MGPLQGTNLGRAGTCEIATWMELFALGIRKLGTASGKSNSFGDQRMTLKVHVYHAVPKDPDVVATTAAEVLQAAAAKLEGPCVSNYYVEERGGCDETAEPYTYVWNEASAVASVAAVEIELEVSKYNTYAIN